MSSKSRNQPSSAGGDGDASAINWRSILGRMVKANSDWPDKDELLDVLYWSRQLLAACIGLIWAVFPLTGVLAIGLYVVVSTVVGHLYVTAYQRVDEESVGGFWELAKEGFGAAFATFMVCWLVGYSALHFP